MATTNASDGGFRRWRRSRPFWGGLLLLIAGLELFLSANLTLGDLEVHMGPEGFLSYLLPLLLVLAGVLSWVTPGQRLFYGVLGLLTAVYSLVGLNLGGFGLGMLLGIFGGALVLAWAPTRPQPQAPAPAASDEDPTAHDTDEDPAPQQHDQHPHDPAATMIVPGFTGGPDDQAGAPAPLRPAEPAQQFPAEPAYPGDESTQAEPPRPSNGVHRKTFVITLVPLAMTAALLIAGSNTPARAEPECPEGLPSRPAAAAKKEAARQSSAKPSPSRTAAKKTPTAKPSASAGPSASGDAEAGEEDDSDGAGNPIVDGWNGLVDGVGDLLGIGDEEQAEPEPEPSTTTEPPATPDPTGTATPSAGPSSPAPGPSGPPGGSGTPSTSPSSASPTPSSSDIPCLGPRVFKDAAGDDTPQVSLKPGLMETSSLTMYDPTYDGVAKLTTATGTVRALKFSMRKAVNKPFRLTVTGPGHVARKDSTELVAEGDVRFYTTRFQGKLFGVIPVTFTPDAPPPLTLPILWFTDAKIDLALVQCDKMTVADLVQTDKA
ncbi:DUF6114 domain-containing protein [Actinoplanes sp. NPDC004185]